MQQPCSREMVGMNNDNDNINNTSSLLNHSQLPSLVQQDNHLHHHHHHHAQPSHFPHASPTTDDFLDQMFSSLPPCSWADLNPNMLPITEPTATSASADDVGGFHNPPHHGLDDQSAVLVSKLRQQQISGGGGGGGAPSSSVAAAAAAARALLLQHQLLNDGAFDVSAVYNNTNGFGGSSLHGVAGQTSNPQRPHFNHPQGQGGSIQQQVAPNFSAQGGSVTNQGAAASASTGGAPGQPRQRVRARRGQATDPHSIAERLRRERIAERMKALQELVPNANKTDKASMLDEIIDYVKFLQLQVKVLSMSRLGGAAAVAPLVADVTSEGGGDCNQTSPNGRGNGNTNNNASSSNDTLTVTEHQVAKLMEEDMGSAMQYLQGKGLCLMPISLATAISTATCRSGRPMGNSGRHVSNVDGPTSPSMSVLTVQSANNICNGSGNGGVDVSVKDAASVCKP